LSVRGGICHGFLEIVGEVTRLCFLLQKSMISPCFLLKIVLHRDIGHPSGNA
jgi:hypothetical protein